jgi:hypothetical protein
MMEQEIEEGLEAPYRPPFREDSADTSNYTEYMPTHIQDGLSGACIEMLKKDACQDSFVLAMNGLSRRSIWAKIRNRKKKKIQR